jgi:DNA-binding NarL/FixJ family response regulator
VRFGHPEGVVGDLRDLAAECHSPLVELLRDHAEALDTRDPVALGRVAARFVDVGSRHFAAEAEAQAATLVAARGKPTDAARLATRARLRWSTCTGAEPSALADAPPGLSPRQLEVAVLASRGRTSREIADELVVSVRTVDNHLRVAYRSLGVAGREALAAVLDGVVD